MKIILSIFVITLITLATIFLFAKIYCPEQTIICPECDGTGAARNPLGQNEAKIPCPICHGMGKKYSKQLKKEG